MQPGPFLRWAGGKRQLLPAIHSTIENIEFSQGSKFYEPFIGGGALFFSLRSLPNLIEGLNGAVINDANSELVELYTVIRDRVDELITCLGEMATDVSEARFYEIRATKFENSIERASRFLYLNRLCFNGLYRVNRSGEFNVPYGKLKKPVVCNDELLKSCSASLKNVEITNVDFELSVAEAKEGDLVYFDPPYVALSKTASFASYQSNGFSDDEHRRLADLIDSLTEKRVHVILSNSDTMLTQSLFRKMNLFSVRANRSISAAAGSRNSVSELLGTNFELRNKSDLLTVISK